MGAGLGARACASLAAAAPPRLRAEWDRVRLVRHLWLGVGAQLARDVPFSALYWTMVEPIRKGLLVSSDAVRARGPPKRLCNCVRWGVC